jgi:hypothetical protein
MPIKKFLSFNKYVTVKQNTGQSVAYRYPYMITSPAPHPAPGQFGGGSPPQGFG